MQSPRCKKLFSFTCKNELTLCRTLKLFLFSDPAMLCWSTRLANISLFSDTWMPTLFPNTDISSTFWPITHKLFGPIFTGFPAGNPASFADNSFSCCCWLHLSVKMFADPSPLDVLICDPESLLLKVLISLIFTCTPKLNVSFLLSGLELIVS